MHEHAAQLPENYHEPFGKIRAIHGRGLSWFHDLGIGYYPVEQSPYDQSYFDKYAGYAATELGAAITDFRVATVNKYFPHNRLVDIGIGSGSFVEERNKTFATYGFDVNPAGVDWLAQRGLFINPYNSYPQAISCWDSFEHIEQPQALLERVREYVFLSIPIFRDLEHVKRSKHFRIDEHFWYFTDMGLVNAMNANGFSLEWKSTMETALGREDIGTYVFKRL